MRALASETGETTREATRSSQVLPNRGTHSAGLRCRRRWPIGPHSRAKYRRSCPAACRRRMSGYRPKAKPPVRQSAQLNRVKVTSGTRRIRATKRRPSAVTPFTKRRNRPSTRRATYSLATGAGQQEGGTCTQGRADQVHRVPHTAPNTAPPARPRMAPEHPRADHPQGGPLAIEQAARDRKLVPAKIS